MDAETKFCIAWVAVGAFADPGFPPPTFSVYAVRRHDWVTLPPSVVESWD